MSTVAVRRPLPPDERFWQRYSPHHEFPLALAVAIFAHGLVVGIGALVVIFLLTFRDQATLSPPDMNAVMIDAGDGFGGFGGLPGAPGDNKTELVPVNAKDQSKEKTEHPVKSIAQSPQDNILTSVSELDVTEFPKDLEMLIKQAEKDAAKTDVPQKVSKGPKMPGVGQGGEGGDGKKGPKGKGGPGGGPRPGHVMTKQEIYANRWRFDMSGTPKQYVDKLVAAGVILVIPDATGASSYVIRDLKRRPIELKREDLEPFKSAVKWWPQLPHMNANLAKELRLRYVPNVHVLFLPKDREEKMAAEEARFARSQGRDPQEIRETWFDFVLQDGVYEPRAIRQN